MNDRARSILKDWVTILGLRHQGVLLTAVRGCDIVPKIDISKDIARFFRGEILEPHCEDLKKSVSFMEYVEEPELDNTLKLFVKSHDHYPHHYIMHLVHAAEILGYYHPNPSRQDIWHNFYVLMVNKFHMKPETKQELDNRLNADEETFGEAQ